MKLSIFPQHGALNSRPVFDAFAHGALKCGHIVVENSLEADAYVIWSVLWHGRMKKNQEIWKFAKNNNKKILILEVGGLVRGQTWKLGVGHINNFGKFWNIENFDHNRPEKLGIFTKLREKNGQNILICGQHQFSEQWENRGRPELWLRNIVTHIKLHTNRHIVFRPHPRDHGWVKFMPKLDIEIEIPQKLTSTYDDFDHEKSFNNAWCVINPCSNTGVQAAIAGIPIFVDKDSLAYEVSNKNFEKIESPEIFDRHDWLIKICHTEWTIDELYEGIPQSRIL